MSSIHCQVGPRTVKFASLQRVPASSVRCECPRCTCYHVTVWFKIQTIPCTIRGNYILYYYKIHTHVCTHTHVHILLSQKWSSLLRFLSRKFRHEGTWGKDILGKESKSKNRKKNKWKWEDLSGRSVWSNIFGKREKYFENQSKVSGLYSEN